MMPDFIDILNHFQFQGEFHNILPYGDGHINDTFLALFYEPNVGTNRYILQRINQEVFENPEAVMVNMVLVTEHIYQQILASGGDPTRKTLTIIPTVDGESCYISPSDDYWRLTRFIPGAQTFLRAQSPQHYYQAAYAFGEFLSLLSDFPISQIHETIPDFHNTPKRYQAFLWAVEEDEQNRAVGGKSEIEFIIARESQVDILANLSRAGKIVERVTHNDAKIDNVMIDDETGEGLCVIDLDTVMPGLSVFDFGDAVRSGANLGYEDDPDISKAGLSLEIFVHLAHGFLDATRGILTDIEVENLACGARLITLEQGIRFLTDYLTGDRYYKIHHPKHNLERARVQLKLVADMEIHREEMEYLINKYR